jgi:hypothetical protein
MLPSAEIAKKGDHQNSRERERERERFIFCHQMCIYISYNFFFFFTNYFYGFESLLRFYIMFLLF